MLFKALKKIIFETDKEPEPEPVRNGFADTIHVIKMAQETMDLVTKYASNYGRCIDDWCLTTLVMFMSDLTKIFEGID